MFVFTTIVVRILQFFVVCYSKIDLTDLASSVKKNWMHYIVKFFVHSLLSQTSNLTDESYPSIYQILTSFYFPAGRGNRNERGHNPGPRGSPEEAIPHVSGRGGAAPAGRVPGRPLADHPPARAAPHIRREGGTGVTLLPATHTHTHSYAHTCSIHS